MTVPSDLTLFHTCDLHIGSCRNVYEYMARAALMCEKIIEVVLSHRSKNKVLVVAGDMLDRTDVTEQERNLALHFVITMIMHKIHVVLVVGNHEYDEADGTSMLDGYHAIKKLNSKYLHVVTHVPETVNITELGVSFLCVPCQQHLTTKRLKKILFELQQKATCDLCYGVVHEALNGSIGDNDRPMRNECDVPDSLSGIRGILLGDIHVQQKMGKGVWYAGSPYQTKINEATKKGILVWTPDRVDPTPVFLKGIPKLLRISDPKKLKQYEGTKHTVKYTGTVRVESEAPNITMQPNLKIIEGSGEIKALVEETRHSALIGLRESLKSSGLSEDEIESGYHEVENTLR